MRKELVIEWRQVDAGSTCRRSEETGMALRAILSEISMLLEMEGVSVQMIETPLPADTVGESDTLLFNGVPLEELLDGIEVTGTPCCSCSNTACQGETECRTLRYNGEDYEAIPPDLIGRAAVKALEME